MRTLTPTFTPACPPPSDVLHRLKTEPKLAQLPAATALLGMFTAKELMTWPLEHEADWKKDACFADKDNGEKRWADFHKRAVQHNIRVVGGYYSHITAARLATLLQLSGDKSEEYLSEMVSDKQLFAKIDRPTGIITFQQKQSPNDVLNSWASDVGDLLGLIENTCHLIAKEHMNHGVA